MRKEVYRVRRPTHIKFGDPWYYKQYQGDELKRLIVDCQPPPELNDARIVLREQSNQISPEYIEYIMTIYYASSAYIHTYTSDMVYPSQKSKDKPISVDTARYVLEVDGRQ